MLTFICSYVFSVCLSIYLYLFHNKPYSTAKRKKQRNRTDKDSRSKKPKNEKESRYNNY